jgi:hypothetical protein
MGAGSLLGAAAGATPWGAIAQAGLGLFQGIGGMIQQKKATKQLENMQSPTYTANQGIMDYYNKALQRYNVDPYQTSMFKMQQQNANRGLASGLNALQGRRAALAGVSNLVQGYNDSSLKAGAAAEQQQGQNLSQLGQAAGAKAGEEQRAFQINQQDPFERKYNLKSMKAGGGVDIMNSGISNIFGAANTLTQKQQLDQMYSNGGGQQSTTNFVPYQKSVYNQLMENRNRRVG